MFISEEKISEISNGLEDININLADQVTKSSEWWKKL